MLTEGGQAKQPIKFASYRPTKYRVNKSPTTCRTQWTVNVRFLEASRAKPTAGLGRLQAAGVIDYIDQRPISLLARAR